MEAIGLDKLRLVRTEGSTMFLWNNLTRPENELITEKTYIKKRMNLFMCVKCDMICAESIPIPDKTFFVNEEERRKKTQTQRVYCLACDEEYSNARKRYGLIKHWLCCCFLCNN
jgi:hypothetical protein